MPDETKDAINPRHYKMGNIEPIAVIEDWNLGYCDGAAVKYIARYRYKGRPAEDLRKAAWYLSRLADRIELSQGRATEAGTGA